jgi:hypothetical protein
MLKDYTVTVEGLVGTAVTTDEGWTFTVGPNNPETQKQFVDGAAVSSFIRKAASNPNYWSAISTADPTPMPLVYPRFIALVRQAGGLTADVALSIVNGTHPSAEVLFLRALLLEATGPIERDDPLIQGGLDMLVSESVITQSGRDTIIAAWPVE